MAVRPRARLAQLLSADDGHALRGARPPSIPVDAIMPYAERVASLYRASRKTGKEHGFLAYATPGGLITEGDAVGTEDAITWHWEEPEATVAFSFHTHPGAQALCVPSGIDIVGAMIRGDHVVYVLTMDGRLSGWRFKQPAVHAKAVQQAIDALDAARKFERPFVGFLYDAFDAMRASVLEPVFAARMTTWVDEVRVEKATPNRAFFYANEWRRG